MDVELTLRMPSHPRYLAVIRAAVGELGSLSGLGDEECQGIILAVDEAVANIIRHAYHGHHEKPIEVNCVADDGRLEFTLLDKGDPPDPARICGQPMDCESLGGRGTHLIRMIMDEVCYERVPAGNRLRLTKKIPPASDGEARRESRND